MAVSNHRGVDPRTWPALEDLPPELYQEVCFAARVYDAVDMLRLYKEARADIGPALAVRWLTDSIRSFDDRDLRQFAAAYRRRYGIALPHLAADATILHYRPPAGPKRRRLRHGIPLRSRSAWNASQRLMPIEDHRAGEGPQNRDIENRFSGLDFLPAA